MLHAALLLFVPFAAAHEYFVAVDGKEEANGAADSPFRSLEQALSVAGPGDRILVRPGVYRVRLVISKGGERDRPLEIVGEEGAILDGGESFEDWRAAPDMGAGVYVNESMPYEPRAVSWRGRTILNLGGGYTYTPELAREILRKPARDPYWEGVEANYVLLDGKHYLRLRDGSAPRGAEFSFAPADSAVVRVANCEHVILRGFRIRNA